MNTRKTEKLQAQPEDEEDLKAQHKPEESPWDDLDKLASPQNSDEMAGVKKVLATVPIKKPNNQIFSGSILRLIIAGISGALS